MIRSALSLLAKKTAIVAVSGVVVIGGAGFALAELHEGEPDTSCDVADTTDVVDETDVADTTEVVDECEVEDTTPTTEVEETTTTTEAEDTTTTSEPDEGEDADETDADDAEATEELEATADDAPEAEELEADSHGAMVSEAARETCWKPENIEAYGNHGQCVRAFAHGEGVDHSAETATEQPAVESDAGDDAPEEPVVEQTSEVQQVESSKPGKGQGNGGGKGNGKGKKG